MSGRVKPSKQAAEDEGEGDDEEGEEEGEEEEDTSNWACCDRCGKWRYAVPGLELWTDRKALTRLLTPWLHVGSTFAPPWLQAAAVGGRV